MSDIESFIDLITYYSLFPAPTGKNAFHIGDVEPEKDPNTAQ